MVNNSYRFVFSPLKTYNDDDFKLTKDINKVPLPGHARFFFK